MLKIEVMKLGKVLKGEKVLDNINLHLESAEIYGIVGSNGSGKTMLLRILGGLIKPTSGKVLINDLEIDEAKKESIKIGMIIENASLYPDFTGLKNLEFLAKINQYIGKEDIIQAIKRVGLDPFDKRPIRKYSLGMKQRIAMAQAIMEHPDILLLDEPTNALDSEGIGLFRQIIKEESSRGALVVITSHNREDIEMLCTRRFRMQGGLLSIEEGERET